MHLWQLVLKVFSISAPSVINVPDDVHVEPVDFLAGLKRLSFYIVNPQLKEELA